MTKTCHHCNKEVVPGKSFCAYHLEAKRLSMQQRREKAKAAGLCRSCCVGIPKPGTTLCLKCHEENHKASKRDRAILKSKGLCAKCRKNPVLPGHSLCGGCTQFNYADKNKSRGKAYTRDNGICQICGSGGFVYVHHIDGSPSRKNGEEYNHDLDNLITLCGSCHVNVHKLARRLDGTPYMKQTLELSLRLLKQIVSPAELLG